MQVKALNNFRANLRAAMEYRGISQRGLATQVGMSYSHINRILQGVNSPSLDICDVLADAVHFSVAELLETPKKFQSSLLTAVAE